MYRRITYSKRAYNAYLLVLFDATAITSVMRNTAVCDRLCEKLQKNGVTDGCRMTVIPAVLFPLDKLIYLRNKRILPQMHIKAFGAAVFCCISKSNSFHRSRLLCSECHNRILPCCASCGHNSRDESESGAEADEEDRVTERERGDIRNLYR